MAIVRVVLYLLLGVYPFCVNAQFTVLPITPTTKLTQWVKQHFCGDGIKLIKATFSGNHEAIGQFTDLNYHTGFGKGIMLSTGNVMDAVGPNSRPNTGANFGAYFFSDPSIKTKTSLCDGAVLTIDFIPLYDSICFDFLFASEEYPEFANKELSDRLSIQLIPLPTSKNSVQLAKLPSGVPIQVSEINPLKNASFYRDNATPQSTLFEFMEYDGLTIPIHSGTRVIAGKTYRLKVVIVDFEDCEYDSGVLLKAYSLRSIHRKPTAFLPVLISVNVTYNPTLHTLPLSPLEKSLAKLTPYTFDSIIVELHADSNANPKHMSTIMGLIHQKELKSDTFVTRLVTKPVIANQITQPTYSVNLIGYRKPM